MPIGQNKLGAFPGEQNCRGPADAAGGTCDDGHFPLDTTVISHFNYPASNPSGL
jgi:hypothetical protein